MSGSKGKKKEGPMGTVATWDVFAGVWSFTTGQYKWRWSAGRGINLLVAKSGDPDEAFESAIFAKNLDHAIMFANGFEGGVAREKLGHQPVK